MIEYFRKKLRVHGIKRHIQCSEDAVETMKNLMDTLCTENQLLLSEAFKASRGDRFEEYDVILDIFELNQRIIARLVRVVEEK